MPLLLTKTKAFEDALRHFLTKKEMIFTNGITSKVADKLSS